MSMIEVKNVTKRFKDKLVLDNVSFNVEEGEMFGLIGPNGAGKSTLINIMTGVMDGGGEILIGGHSIRKEAVEAKRLIGVVPQEVAVMSTVSAYDNLEFFGALYGLKGKILKERIDEVLEITGLTEKRKEMVKKFSGGMKRRLNIAAAIMHHPKILIMDEPTVGIDPQSRNHIFEFTKKINKERKTTVIYTSHYMEEVEHLCENIFIIDLGKEIAYGSKKKIKSMVAGENKAIISLDKISENIINNIRVLEGVKDCQAEGNDLKLVIREKDFKLMEALKLIEASKADLKSINFEDVSLEEVFLKLTGKKLRD
ncbi:ABC transporter ATP-binding protein [Clostridium sp. 19966]|uniref:ABC transporter ATP-binding protein n=1 Tax=Clostridium sp. 19966 TaxID=2768166 RepID=UPI0028DE6795|nr:ABC transporter ATP-binding protein [Clostridium sp. 19966]MDT8718900.1 ABC transporter ATP-binding protein [Clostridium sp. 19966]